MVAAGIVVVAPSLLMDSSYDECLCKVSVSARSPPRFFVSSITVVKRPEKKKEINLRWKGFVVGSQFKGRSQMTETVTED